MLIKKHNDKVKECNILDEQLTSVKNEKIDLVNKQNLSMAKIAELELVSDDFLFLYEILIFMKLINTS